MGLHYLLTHIIIWASAQQNLQKTCVTSKDSHQPVHPPSITRVLIYPSLDSLEAVKGTCDQRRLWSDCTHAQADLSLRWSLELYCRFCRALPYSRKHKKGIQINTFKFSYSPAKTCCGHSLEFHLHLLRSDWLFLQCVCCLYSLDSPRVVKAILMSPHNIWFYEEN